MIAKQFGPKLYETFEYKEKKFICTVTVLLLFCITVTYSYCTSQYQNLMQQFFSFLRGAPLTAYSQISKIFSRHESQVK